ncbi:Venom allergen [Ooceraea biroi]|uniref:Venom allergen n=1 Tax=Ooceraea biroi TaxID=2015173 RepID=A0A026WIA3_OOCBI|nr:Venom allergen [Ooceraea biroi]
MTRFFNLLSLAVLAGVFISANAVNYCNLASCRGKMHTMCAYTSSAPGPNCQQAHDAGLTNSEKDLIVRKHNELRQRVASGQETRGSPGPQPPASNMQDLTWDDELATIAQRWANQCIYKHDKCRNVERYQVGQNIARSSATGMEPAGVGEMIDDWYNEVALFDNSLVSSYQFSMDTAHYTQMVWATTAKIGCGRIKYKNERGWDTNFFVCNYGPSGNWKGKKMYEIRQ